MTDADKLVHELATLTDPLENDDAAEILDAFVSGARTIVRDTEHTNTPSGIETITLPELNADALDDDDPTAAAFIAHAGHTFRVRWSRDEYAAAPDFDANTPMVYLDDGYDQTYKHAGDVLHAYRHFWELSRDTGADAHTLLERWLRIYAGASVVMFRYLGAVQGSPLAVFFDTAAWRQMTGWVPGAPGNPAEESAASWYAYSVGDVYVYALDVAVVGTVTWPDGSTGSVTEWATVDSCGGFYGDDELSYVLAEYAAPAVESFDGTDSFGNPVPHLTPAEGS